MAGHNGLLAVLGPKLAPIQVISVVATNCKEGSKMLYWSTCYEMILDVGNAKGMPSPIRARVSLL